MSALVTRRPPLTKAMYFDGVSSYVVIPNNSSLQITGDLTIELLYMPVNVAKGRQNPIDKAYWGEFAYTQEPDGEISFYFGCCPYVGYHTGGGIINNYKWIHLALVRRVSDKYVGIYVNGVTYPYYIENSWANPQATSRNVTIGTGYAGYFAGYIALVRLYSYALSQSEVLHNYRNPNNPVRSGLVLWLDARNVSGNKWYDLSGYGNHGTIYGATQVSLPNPPGGW